MNSPKSIIYMALRSHIPSFLTGAYVARDTGQLETKERPAVDYPCALVSFRGWKFTDTGNNEQLCEGDVVIKIAQPAYAADTNHTPDDQVEHALDAWEVDWVVEKNLHGWSPDDNIGYLTRTDCTEDLRRPGLCVVVLTYRLSYTDRSAAPTLERVPAIPDLTVIMPLPSA